MLLTLILLVGKFDALRLHQQKRGLKYVSNASSAKTETHLKNAEMAGKYAPHKYAVGAGFGGGGCHGTVSQLGFLRGLLSTPVSGTRLDLSANAPHLYGSTWVYGPNNPGVQGVKLGAMGTTSGGSVAIGMALANMHTNNIELSHEGILGTPCMRQELEIGASREAAMAEMLRCGQCAMKEAGCTWGLAGGVKNKHWTVDGNSFIRKDGYINLGLVADNCMLPSAMFERVLEQFPGWPLDSGAALAGKLHVDAFEKFHAFSEAAQGKDQPPSLLQTNWDENHLEKNVEDMDFNEASIGRRMFAWSWKMYVWGQFFVRHSVPRNLRVGDVSDVLQTGPFNDPVPADDMEQKYGRSAGKWSVSWSKLQGLELPGITGNMVTDGTEKDVTSDFTILEAVSRSSDAVSMFAWNSVLAAQLAFVCDESISMIQSAQQYFPDYPFPFGDDRSKFPNQKNHMDMILRQLDTSKSNPIKLSMKQMKKLMNAPTSMVQFATNEMTQQQRLGFLKGLMRSTSVDEKQGSSVWYMSGAAIDDNGIGETVRMLSKVGTWKRLTADGDHGWRNLPKAIVSLISGSAHHTSAHKRNRVIDYFHENIDYKSLFQVDETGVSPLDSCAGLGSLQVKNPNYFFKKQIRNTQYRATPFKSSFANETDEDLGLGGGTDCQLQDVISHSLESKSQKCHSLRYQMENAGAMYVPRVTLVANEKWGINSDLTDNPNNTINVKKPWVFSIFFSILDNSEHAQTWINEAYASWAPTQTAATFKDFPMIKGAHFDFFGARRGFAMMQYNQYKGFMLTCTILQSMGSTCKYCIDNGDECNKWSPIGPNPNLQTYELMNEETGEHYIARM